MVDSSESELGVLDLIQVLGLLCSQVDITRVNYLLQVFVEALDRAFENVCELDLVFNFDEAGFYPLYSSRVQALTVHRHITYSQRWSKAALCSKRM